MVPKLGIKNIKNRKPILNNVLEFGSSNQNIT